MNKVVLVCFSALFAWSANALSIKLASHAQELSATRGGASLKGGLEWRFCPQERRIKGNINLRTGEKIYHLPGGSFYERTNPEACFRSKLEAEMAGFRASKR